MITTNNYFNKIASINFNDLPDALKKGNEFVKKVTGTGSDWNTYQGSDAIKKTIDLYILKLNEFLNTATTDKSTTAKTKSVSSLLPKEQSVKKSVFSETTKQVKVIEQPMMVECIPEEIRFIKRFINLDGKTKLKEDILRFINALQKAIVEKKIRKTSSYADQIKFIQSNLIKIFNSMKAKIKIELKPETFEALKKFAGVEKVLPSIGFIKQYIGLNEKPGMKQKAKLLLDHINNAYTKGKITDNDPYIVEIHELKNKLKSFINTASQKTLAIEQSTLNGLEGVLGCASNNLNGFEAKPAIMNSMDFANMEFDTLGFQGKWLDLIGDPSRNFTAMVFGKPKMGKSYLCIDFAGYLARNHGSVLYVAREEGLDYTLQMKLNDKNVKHPNLFVSSVLPENLSSYDFIFLDSVNKLGLLPQDLNRLKASNLSKSFIFIFQATKAGTFRGDNTFQHDVDIVIEVPEKGKAVQMGRFNQGGEIEIF